MAQLTDEQRAALKSELAFRSADDSSNLPARAAAFVAGDLGITAFASEFEQSRPDRVTANFGPFVVHFYARGVATVQKFYSSVGELQVSNRRELAEALDRFGLL